MPGLRENIFLSGNGKSGAEKKVSLFFHRYRYFPYEKELARREVRRFAGACRIVESTNGMTLIGPVHIEPLRRLTYISAITADGTTVRTIQHDLEKSDSGGGGRRTGSRPAIPCTRCMNTRAGLIHRLLVFC
jgi:hypothetical protein